MFEALQCRYKKSKQTLESMENHFSLSKERKLEVVAMLIDMAGVDNRIETSESKYIAGVASQMGLNMEDISQVVKDPKAFSFKSPPDEHERMTILYYLLFPLPEIKILAFHP